MNLSSITDYCATILESIVNQSASLDIFGEIFSNSWSSDLLSFTDFQVIIFRTFSLILVVNIFLVIYFWKKYGKDITENFIRPSNLFEIEELKKSVEKLKLPREHTPRI